MKAEDTLYEALEVSPRASTDVIRAAYRCLAQHHHPDKHAGAGVAHDRQVKINHAYAILSDPAMRLRYDRSMGLDQRLVERRGAHVEPHRSAASSGAGRPFGFRPL